MKKNYLKPEIESIPVTMAWAVCSGSDPLSSDPNSGNSSTPTVPMPKRRTPAF